MSQSKSASLIDARILLPALADARRPSMPAAERSVAPDDEPIHPPVDGTVLVARRRACVSS